MMGFSVKGRVWKKAASRVLRVIARPVRRAQGEGGIVLEPYRGYGSRTEVFVIGRVFRQSRPDRTDSDSFRTQMRDIGRRITRRSVPGAVVTARFGGTEERVETDRDGYFRIHLSPRIAPPADRTWHDMELVLDGALPVRAEGRVFIPSGLCRCVVVSDIDDTVMRTGVANKVRMLWRLFVEDAESRVAFPGVAALYRALYAGSTGDQANPMIYVSRAPWGLYDLLTEFFTLHGIPVGPILFLREWGVSWRSPLPRKAEDHKRDIIGNMLALYADLPFVLIGDSGQHDPEVYARIVADHPGRVSAVYIRNVSRDSSRIREIEALADAVAASGSSLVLAADSVAMAKHAAGLGLIAPEAIADVAREKSAFEASEPPVETRRIEAGATARASTGEELAELLGGPSSEPPPNVVVEPADRDRQRSS